VHKLLRGRASPASEAATVRKLRNVGDVDAVYLCDGRQGRYVDGRRVPEGEEQPAGAATIPRGLGEECEASLERRATTPPGLRVNDG